MAWTKHTKTLAAQQYGIFDQVMWSVWPTIEWQRTSNSNLNVKVKLSVRVTEGWDTETYYFGIDNTVLDTNASYHSSGNTYELTGSKDITIHETPWKTSIEIEFDTFPNLHKAFVYWNCELEYEAGEYTVFYDATGGSPTPASQTKRHGTDLTLSYTRPSKTGHSFDGWAAGSESWRAAQWQPGDQFRLDQNITLYAKWTPNTYRVTYNGNGGTGIPTYQTKTYNVPLQLSGTTPTRTGYTFTGWNTSAGGGGDSFSPNGWYYGNTAITLYAQWKIITYTVSYNANGGSNAPSSQTKTYGVDLTLTTATPTRTGYKFKGWATSSSGDVAYSPGARYTANANITLYAKWEIITYQVYFNVNGGTGTISAQTKIYGQTLYLTNTRPTRQNYDFLGWNTKSDGTGTTYASGGAYTDNASVTLYAKWKLTEYKIYYNANGGSNPPSTQTAGVGTNVALRTGKPTKSTVYNTYTVTYDKVAPDSTISKNSDSVTVATIYTFDRWNTRPDGTGISYAPGQSFKVPAQNTTLYAIYTISWNGSVTLPTGTLTQWKIGYWSTSLTDPELNRVGDPYTPNKNITLYAIWAPIGTGGYLRFPSSTGIPGIDVGSKLYITGFHNPENDGPKTVQSYTYDDGVVELIFAEDFAFAGQQDASDERLHIYGDGNIVPDFDYICALNNRLWGCNSKTRTIYGSALGDPTDFWTFAGDALDAFQVAVGSGGDFTGAVAMNNNVLFLKQHTIHKILGNFPAEYMLYTYDIDGTSASNGLSAINCDGLVIFVTEHGIGTYTGSSAGQLSKELGEGNMNHAKAMYNGEQYFLYFTSDDGEPKTYIFDTRYNIWVEAQYQDVLDFAHMDDADYALLRSNKKNAISIFDDEGNILWDNLTSTDDLQIYDENDELLWDLDTDLEAGSPEIYDEDGEQLWPVDLPYGNVYRIDSGEDLDDDWEIVFKPFYEDIYSSGNSRSHVFEKKQYTGITFRIELPKDSWIKAELRSDDGRWIPVARKAGNADRVLDFVVKTPRMDKVQLRLSGHGPMTILSMEREYRIGSRR